MKREQDGWVAGKATPGYAPLAKTPFELTLFETEQTWGKPLETVGVTSL